MAVSTWGIDDPLLRGDCRERVSAPDPRADPRIVRHILYLDGPGRPTPYSSTTEDEETARRFAGGGGRIWYTKVDRVQTAKLRYVSRQELMALLRGTGKGDAAWPSASEVQTARMYVEQWGEHLVDFRSLGAASTVQVEATVANVYAKGRP